MPRLLAGLVGLLCLSSDALFAAAPPTKVDVRPAAFSRTRKPPVSVSPSADFQISVLSEVRLNGRLCSFKDVPDNAVITKLEVDPDTKEVVIVHFSTKK